MTSLLALLTWMTVLSLDTARPTLSMPAGRLEGTVAPVPARALQPPSPPPSPLSPMVGSGFMAVNASGMHRLRMQEPPEQLLSSAIVSAPPRSLPFVRTSRSRSASPPSFPATSPAVVRRATSECFEAAAADADGKLPSLPGSAGSSVHGSIGGLSVTYDVLVLILSSRQRRLSPARRREAVRHSWAHDSSELGAADSPLAERCSVRYLQALRPSMRPQGLRLRFRPDKMLQPEQRQHLIAYPRLSLPSLFRMQVRYLFVVAAPSTPPTYGKRTC